MRDVTGSSPDAPQIALPEVMFPCTTEERIRRLAWRKCGIIRSGEQLDEACRELQKDWQERNPDAGLAEFCLRNMHTVALLIARCALAREESRGAHFRTDYPEKLAAFERHSVISKSEDVRFR